MSGNGRVREEARGFDAEPLVGLHEIGPDDELDEHDLEGIADADAGRVVSHEAVMAWLDDFIAGNRQPAPRSGK